MLKFVSEREWERVREDIERNERVIHQLKARVEDLEAELKKVRCKHPWKAREVRVHGHLFCTVRYELVCGLCQDCLDGSYDESEVRKWNLAILHAKREAIDEEIAEKRDPR